MLRRLPNRGTLGLPNDGDDDELIISWTQPGNAKLVQMINWTFIITDSYCHWPSDTIPHPPVAKYSSEAIRQMLAESITYLQMCPPVPLVKWG